MKIELRATPIITQVKDCPSLEPMYNVCLDGICGSYSTNEPMTADEIRDEFNWTYPEFEAAMANSDKIINDHYSEAAWVRKTRRAESGYCD
jgi:hypothetical protein